MGALTAYYPYDRILTWKHFAFNPSTGGIGSFANSIQMSVLTAVVGTVFVFQYAYFIEKSKCAAGLKSVGKLLSSLPSFL